MDERTQTLPTGAQYRTRAKEDIDATCAIRKVPMCSRPTILLHQRNNCNVILKKKGEKFFNDYSFRDPIDIKAYLCVGGCFVAFVPWDSHVEVMKINKKNCS
ncbi:hypothetical protein V1478_005452 [Vespula squamosa]|uniref:Reverse transcriptase domain-containing protein n=1 Tax=Vespula squamosa TaxID=30214 RepID=A0ABD2BEC7_VESSQ